VLGRHTQRPEFGTSDTISEPLFKVFPNRYAQPRTLIRIFFKENCWIETILYQKNAQLFSEVDELLTK
jgi:hypothetical protein